MNRIYNFNDYPTKKKTYGGANGNKLSLVIDDSVIYISENHKEFLKKIIKARKDIIIDKNLL